MKLKVDITDINTVFILIQVQYLTDVHTSQETNIPHQIKGKFIPNAR